jgi:hypothetical protein
MSTTAWYLDIRDASTSEHVSLDLTRHLPRRLMVGPALIVSDRPDILLAVIRKRWMRVIQEVQKQLSSTLDRHKKLELSREIERMRSFRFTVHLDAHADAVIIPPSLAVCELPRFSSLYILTPLTSGQFLDLTDHALPNALVAVYGEWDVYERVLRSLIRRLPHYGEKEYPSSFSTD